MNDLVSVVLPVYNAERWVAESVYSVLEQTHGNIELIAINDCSTDRSLDILLELAKIDDRMKVIDLSKNRGAAGARNEGIERATGRYLSFIDSDDMWIQDKLEKQLRFMKQTHAVLSFTGYTIVDEKGKPVKQISQMSQQVTYRNLLKGNCIACSTVMVDLRKLGSMRMPEIKHEDYATWLSILRQGAYANGLSESLTLYRKSETSISSNKWESAKWTWEIYRRAEGLGLVESCLCFAFYAVRGFRKHFLP